MIEYFGRHGCKQCIRNKLVKFGFKPWCLDSRKGYLAVYDIYQGATHGSSTNYEEKFGKGGKTLLALLDKLPEFIQSMPLDFYFDNYFTSSPLINHLTTMN